MSHALCAPEIISERWPPRGSGDDALSGLSRAIQPTFLDGVFLNVVARPERDSASGRLKGL